jgi:hypothetical protein
MISLPALTSSAGFAISTIPLVCLHCRDAEARGLFFVSRLTASGSRRLPQLRTHPARLQHKRGVLSSDTRENDGDAFQSSTAYSVLGVVIIRLQLSMPSRRERQHHLRGGLSAAGAARRNVHEVENPASGRGLGYSKPGSGPAHKLDSAVSQRGQTLRRSRSPPVRPPCNPWSQNTSRRKFEIPVPSIEGDQTRSEADYEPLHLLGREWAMHHINPVGVCTTATKSLYHAPCRLSRRVLRP